MLGDVFDPKAELLIYEHCRPHWSQAGAIGERGKFWQQEPFDHLVRSPEQYEYLREYIADNPRKAGLRSGEFLYRRYG